MVQARRPENLPSCVEQFRSIVVQVGWQFSPCENIPHFLENSPMDRPPGT